MIIILLVLIIAYGVWLIHATRKFRRENWHSISDWYSFGNGFGFIILGIIILITNC